MYFAAPVLQPIFGTLMACLFVLHVYWFILMVRIVLAIAFYGKTEDTVNIVKKSQKT